MDINIDLYYLITQGQFSVDNYGKGFTTPHGFFIYVEEEIIEVPVSRGGTTGGVTIDKNYQDRFKRKKKITLRFEYEGESITKEIIIENENLSVKSTNIHLEEGIVELNLYNVKIEDSETSTIKVKIKDW
jgi:hypothetical protein